jgi:hypothetical protein
VETENALTYTKHGDYYLPDFTLPETPQTRPIGMYGQRHGRYLKTHRRITYINLLTSGKLHSYLADIDEQATERLELLMRQMAATQGITEALKAADQMAWVGAMNNIRASAEDVVLKELIYS